MPTISKGRKPRPPRSLLDLDETSRISTSTCCFSRPTATARAVAKRRRQRLRLLLNANPKAPYIRMTQAWRRVSMPEPRQGSSAAAGPSSTRRSDLRRPWRRRAAGGHGDRRPAEDSCTGTSSSSSLCAPSFKRHVGSYADDFGRRLLL